MPLTFIYPPTLPWSFMTQRPQQLALALGRRGHQFFFCEKDPQPGAPPTVAVAPGVTVVNDMEVLDSYWNDAVVFASWARHRFVAARGRLAVFDNLDDFPEWEDDDLSFMRSADVVFCSSQALLQRAEANGVAAHLVPNGCNPWEWQQPGEAPAWLAAIPRPRALFSGALGGWVNTDLIETLAHGCPDVSFVCVGVNWSALRSHDNLYIVGERPYAELPAVLGACQVGIIPFHETRVTLAADPIKQYEYTAAGLPFISTPLPEIGRVGAGFTADSLDRWATWLRTLVQEGDLQDRLRDLFRDMAALHTWDDRAIVIENVVTKALEGKLCDG